MRKYLGVFILMLTVGSLLFSCSGKKDSTSGEGKEAIGDVAALVNGEAITMPQVDRVVSHWRQSEKAPVDLGLPVTELRKEALKQLTERILLFQEAERKGFRADSLVVDRQMQAFMSRFRSPEELTEALTGMNFELEELREAFKQDLSIQEFIQADVSSSISIDSTAIRRYYDENMDQFVTGEEVEAQHILFKLDQEAPAEEVNAVLERANPVLARAKSGEDFDALAKEFSEGPTGPNGGHLGSFGRNRMVAPFDEAVFALKVGKVSELVRTRFGFHIIKLESRKEGGRMAFSQARPQIENQLRQEALGEKLSSLVETLRKDADIKSQLN
ncbi:MAG: peptidylprolyl isomerase [Candidatus Eisenbacteria bacterium]|uniref:Peptidylprolyl isomerase n=1 Tax=Eiseniibacteriota bacterium TaxID=2212470 RepID=A0A948RVM3_UNCEI|nr:peptidylprolyl isomerase [Candidatus Eisenbacteria bacterium]MBU1947324.1 peptidylprolyl isomerase [Candidatus Eisenbacteria bacterium]MBU2690524.1 peptidylprolyl isomerase [Candidatus Eisenbacteria bacterium]